MNQGRDLDSTFGLLKAFFTDAPPFSRTDGDRINKPVLKITVINSLRDFVTDNPIPYLEYQLLSDVNAGSPSDTSQTITAEGFSGEFKQILEVKQPQEGGILEYVVQQ